MPLNPNMVAIQTVTVGAGGASTIEFTNIPQTYTDLIIKYSGRLNANVDPTSKITFNNSTTGYTNRVLYGNGSGAFSFTNTPGYAYGPYLNNSANTTNSFSNGEVYIPNYTSNTNKTMSLDNVTETAASEAYQFLSSSLWANSAAITTITLAPINAPFVQHSTATLYGVTSAGYGATKATGGAIHQDNTYWYHVFANSGTFAPTQSITADILVVAGGGGGGQDNGGGGGAGGLLGFTSQALTAQNYTVTIGAGGAGATGTNANSNGSTGSDSQFGALTLVKGGGGAGGQATGGANGKTGGSGGGAGNGGTGGGVSVSGQGNIGGNGLGTTTSFPGGGGGGAGAAGGNAVTTVAGNGGQGSSAYSSWGLATGTGENYLGTVYYAGGGGGAGAIPGTGGYGGGGNGGFFNGSPAIGTAGRINTGGGGGGATGSANVSTTSAGGSGLVIVRYAK